MENVGSLNQQKIASQLVKFAGAVDKDFKILWRENSANLAFAMPIPKPESLHSQIEFDIIIKEDACTIRFIFFNLNIIGRILTLEDAIPILPEEIKVRILYNLNSIKDYSELAFGEERTYYLDFETMANIFKLNENK